MQRRTPLYKLNFSSFRPSLGKGKKGDGDNKRDWLIGKFTLNYIHPFDTRQLIQRIRRVSELIHRAQVLG
jgi:hypothetical protein